jgi:hypothetical protein
MKRRRYSILLLVLFACTAAWALAQPTAEEMEQRWQRLEAMRKHPDQLARLRDNLQAYLHLPEARREAIAKLDRDLHELPAKKQQRLLSTLERYADWLDELRKRDPQGYQAIKAAPDSASRLALIKDRRDREWMDLQPKKYRDEWKSLQGDARADYVLKRRQEDRTKHARWVIAKRFWKELESKQAMPSKLADYSVKVKEYVTFYLMPMLTAEEAKRLADADGRWPDYPQALVEIASKYPSALPPERKDALPRKLARLPDPVRHKLIDKKGTDKTAIAKKVQKELLQAEGPNFVSKVVAIGLRENKLPFGHEYWACNYKSLLKPMQEFVDQKLDPALDQVEKRKLIDSEGKWPDYPLTIQELSQKLNLSPPWHYLPEAKLWKWDEYRHIQVRSWGSEVAKEKKSP